MKALGQSTPSLWPALLVELLGLRLGLHVGFEGDRKGCRV
jgi:hypothetical protein